MAEVIPEGLLQQIQQDLVAKYTAHLGQAAAQDVASEAMIRLLEAQQASTILKPVNFAGRVASRLVADHHRNGVRERNGHEAYAREYDVHHPAPEAPDPHRNWRSRRAMARWLLEARKLGVSRCKRCGEGLVEGSYNPDAIVGRELWSRCWNCGWRDLALCQPKGARLPFHPPVDMFTVTAAGPARIEERAS